MERNLKEIKYLANCVYASAQGIFDYYAAFVKESSFTNQPELKLVYPALGLAGEMGEVIEHVKKIVRDKKGVVSPEDRQKLNDEIGDVLWYVTRLAQDCEVDVCEALVSNVEKLTHRAEFGK